MTISNEGIQGGLELLARIIARKVITQESTQSASPPINGQGMLIHRETTPTTSGKKPPALHRKRVRPEAVSK